MEKLAVEMEKEMFNMSYTTDEEYKNKYQCLVLTLNDPQNKVIFDIVILEMFCNVWSREFMLMVCCFQELCHRVLKGAMPSVKLIQLSQQEVKYCDVTSKDSC